MATLTYDPTPADNPEFNEAEQEALAIGEAQEQAEQQMYAGKFKDAESLEQAYIELQKKLGDPYNRNDNEVQTASNERQEEPAAQEEVEQEPEVVQGELTEDHVREIQSIAGGSQQYDDMLAWAGQNLNENEIKMFDGVIEKGDPSSCFFAVQALHTRYTDAVGQDGQLLTGRGSNEPVDVFRSQAEVVRAMQDSRYDKDPAFRQDVFNKLERSNLQY